MKLNLLVFVVLCWHLAGYSQAIIGQNEVKCFSRNEYAAGTQNWQMVQDPQNRIYIANNEGLLVFDGTNWQLFPVPNKTILRSICFGPGGKLFAGAQDELGYFAPDKAGRLIYTSLKDRLPAAERKFTDVWQIEVAGNDVFFRTDTKIFKFSGEDFTVYTSSSAWLSLHTHLNTAIAQDAGNGLMVFRENRWQTLFKKDQLPDNFLITDVIAYQKDTSLLSTEKHGFYLLSNTNLVHFPIHIKGFDPFQHFTTLSMGDSNSFLAGSYFNGIYHISRQGQLLENISAKNGLINNTIRCIYPDRNGNAWAGLDNGIAFLGYNNAIKHINPPGFNNGAGYAAKLFNNDLYFATSTGLQWLPVAAVKDLSAIANEPRTILGGLTWNISIINNKLLCGRDDGCWEIINHQAAPVSRSTGYWTFQRVPGSVPLQIAAGNYLGIHFFETDGNSWSKKSLLNNFNESSRYLETDQDNIWMSHPYRGVYKINITNKTVTLYKQKDGLPADLDNHVFKIKNKILFATSKGIYEYNPALNKMEPAREYLALFGERPVRYLKEDEKGNIWFVQDKMAGVADYSTKQPQLHYIPELKNKILSGFENIFPYNTNNVLVGSETGFYHINYEKYRNNIRPFAAYLTAVRITGRRDSVIFGGFSFTNDEEDRKISIPHKWNSLHFAFAASAPGLYSNTEFSYFLEGFDMKWSAWSENAEKDYTNLPAGTYSFRVKARKSPTHESTEYIYVFTITPPWYLTIWAYALYLFACTGLLFLLFRFQEKKHKRKQEIRRLADLKKFEEEQKQMAYQHHLALEKSEKERIRFKNEKLQAAIEFKNAELASTTMNLVQKKEFLLKLKNELQHLQKNIKADKDNPELKKLLRVLSEEEKLNEEWEQFSQHFNSVHGDFLSILKNKFPALKPHELRLCAYLRMNLSSKEIAPLMSISVRGVEISRYRLRKKLGLPTETNLVQFLLDL